MFRIAQIKPDTGELDEHKYVIGCWSSDEAKELYLSHIPKKFFGSIEQVDLKTLEKYQKRK